MNTQQDYEDAMNAKIPVFGDEVAGQVTVQVYPCVLQKGVGKVPFDATQHKESDKRTAVDMFLMPLDGDKCLERRMVAQSDEWVKIVLPSLKACGVLSLANLNAKYALVHFEPTGRKYTDKYGEEKMATTFKFLKVFGTEAELRAAVNGGQPAPTVAPAPAPAQGGNGGNQQRDVALKFLPTMIKTWCKDGLDPEKVRAGLAGNPIFSKHFTVDSPEVVAEMMKQVPA